MKHSFLWAILWLWLPIAAHGQLTLEECQTLAKQHYPALAQYDLITLSEQYSVSNAARAWIPQLTLSAQATLQSAVATFPEPLENMLAAQGVDMPGMRHDQYKVALDLRQNIWDGGAAKANENLAKADAAEQRTVLDVEMYKILERINALYLGTLLLDEKMQLMQHKIELLDAHFVLVQSHQTNGIAMQSDVDAIEVELLTAQQEMAQMQSSYHNFRAMLEIFIGEPIGERQLVMPSMESEVPLLEIARPELTMYQAKQQKLLAQEKLIKSASMPRFQLFAQGYYGYPGFDMFQSMMSNDWTLNGIVGVGMSWNFAGLYTQKNKLTQLRTAAKMVQVQEDVFRFHSNIEQTQENSEIVRLRKALELDERIVELKNSVRKTFESKHRNGVINTTELLQKITEEHAAQLARSVRQVELIQAIYQLKFTTNN